MNTRIGLTMKPINLRGNSDHFMAGLAIDIGSFKRKQESYSKAIKGLK